MFALSPFASDQGNSPGDCVWMGWWGYAKREELENVWVVQDPMLVVFPPVDLVGLLHATFAWRARADIKRRHLVNAVLNRLGGVQVEISRGSRGRSSEVVVARHVRPLHQDIAAKATGPEAAGADAQPHLFVRFFVLHERGDVKVDELGPAARGHQDARRAEIRDTAWPLGG